MENKELKSIENEELNSIFNSIEQRKNKFREFKQSQTYNHLTDLYWKVDKFKKQYKNDKNEIIDFIIESKGFLSTVIGKYEELWNIWLDNIDDQNKLKQKMEHEYNNKDAFKMLESKLRESDNLGRDIFMTCIRLSTLSRYVEMLMGETNKK